MYIQNRPATTYLDLPEGYQEQGSECKALDAPKQKQEDLYKIKKINYIMHADRLIFIIGFCLLVSCKTSKKLLFPIKGGESVDQSSQHYFRRDKPHAVVFATKYFSVRGCERGVVKNIIKIGEIYTIRIVGEYEIWYGNLANFTVSKGDTIRKGAIIGEVPRDGDENAKAFLEVIIKKQEKQLRPDLLW